MQKTYPDIAKLELLVDTIQKLSLARDVNDVTKIVRTVARQLTGADGATFVLRDQNQCYYADEDAIGPLWKGKRFPITACISGWAMINKTSVIIEDIYNDNRIPIDAYRQTFVKSLAMVPIRSIDPLGAIGNYWAQKYQPNIEEITMLQSLADITAVSIENIEIRNKLEQKVMERTEELNQRNILIEEKNKDITDSIIYAKRIQDAKLHTTEELKEHFQNSFLLLKPKDIISGDFYHIKEKDNLKFISASDCTGHGVPGAFISMICSEKLNDVLLHSSDPSEILYCLNQAIKKTLRQTDNDNSTRDGMDIALCVVDIDNCIIKFSGANRPLWVIRKGSTVVEEIKSTKKAIGGLTESTQHFETHTLQLQHGDCFYIFSDGYADTFGSTHDKKLTTKKFKEILLSIQDKSMTNQGAYLDNFIENWKEGRAQIDDILVIGICL